MPDDSTGKTELSAQVNLSWLLHLLSAGVSYRIGEGLNIDLRIIGIRLPFFRKKEDIQSETYDTPLTYEITDTVPEPEDIHSETDDEQLSDLLHENSELSDLPAEEPDLSESFENNTADNEKTDEDEPEPMLGEQPPKKSRIISLLEKIQQIPQKIAELIQLLLMIPEKVMDMIWIILEAPDKVTALFEQIGKKLEKPLQLKRFAEKAGAKDVLIDVLDYLKYLLMHYKPRKVCGHVRIGLGDPALSAEATGLIYLILPAQADKFEVQTDFYEYAFETDIICSGHIRAAHLVRVGIRALRNRRLWRLIKLFRKRNQHH